MFESDWSPGNVSARETDLERRGFIRDRLRRSNKVRGEGPVKTSLPVNLWIPSG